MVSGERWFYTLNLTFCGPVVECLLAVACSSGLHPGLHPAGQSPGQMEVDPTPHEMLALDGGSGYGMPVFSGALVTLVDKVRLRGRVCSYPH